MNTVFALSKEETEMAAEPRTHPLVLVADDDPIMRLLMRQSLEQGEFVIEEAENGVQALDAVERLSPDLILLDVLMPELDGFDTCVALRRRPESAHTPIIMVTGLDDMDSINHAYEVGATDFITKPITWPILPHRLRYALRASQAITQLRRSEETLRQQETLFRRLVESSSAFVFVYQESRLRYMNSAGGVMLGYNQVELANTDLFDLVHPNFREQVQEQIQLRLQGRPAPPQYEMKVLHKDGSERWMLFTGSRIELEGNPALLGVAFDISEQKNAREVRAKLQQELFQSQKQQALGRLAGNIAQHCNNLLTPILGFTELTLEDLPPESEMRSYLKEVHSAGLSAARLMQQILSFCRPSANSESAIPWHYVIEEVLPRVRTSLPSTISLHYEEESSTGSVWADPAHLEQILINLCHNATYAMKDKGGTLTLTLAEVSADAIASNQFVALPPGPYVRLTVRDTGHGIAPEFLSRIFDPFFTTKGVGEGSGLGLSIVHSIVTNSKGAITVESTQGQGSAFHVYLPRFEVTEAAAESSASVAYTGEGRLLVVDNDAAVTQVTQQMLERAGYHLTIAADGIEAWEKFRKAPDAFDVVLTAHTMPGLTGVELASTLLQLRPSIPIVLCADGNENLTAEEVKRSGCHVLLPKPYSQATLLGAIENALCHSAS